MAGLRFLKCFQGIRHSAGRSQLVIEAGRPIFSIRGELVDIPNRGYAEQDRIGPLEAGHHAGIFSMSRYAYFHHGGNRLNFLQNSTGVA
jgi:hypothetical protein